MESHESLHESQYDQTSEIVRRQRETAMVAVAATSTAYTADGSIDVVARLREELSIAGGEQSDDAWLQQVARLIRSGIAIDLDDPDTPRPGA